MFIFNSPTPVASTSTAHLRPNGARSRHVIETGTLRPTLSRKDTDVKGKGRARTTLRAKLLKVDFRRKGWVGEGFRVFGEHCARNQIRTLLIDCFVMTNLFYPALSVYLQKRFPPLHPPSPPSHNTHRVPFSTSSSGVSAAGRFKKEHPLSLLSTPVLDSFFPYPPPLLPRLTWAGWWGRDTGQYPDEDGWEVVRFEGEYPAEEEIRLMRVAWADVGDVLDSDPSDAERGWTAIDHVLLDLLRKAVEGWEKDFPESKEGCVRQLQPESNTAEPTGPCFLFSPHDHPPEPGVLVFSELASHMNTTQDERTVPVGWTANAGSFYHSIALPMRVPRRDTSGFTKRWADVMERVGGETGGELFTEAQGPRNGDGDQTGKWLLSYRTKEARPASDLDTVGDSPSTQVPSNTAQSPPKLALLLYLLLFSVLGRQLSDATKVHSRFGLAFTGIVQLCCSGVMSFSILVLLGWNGLGFSRHEATLPTYVLPFVIVVVGAENMSTLTRAVFSVPFTYSVPVRIGLGLSKVGSTIAITSFTDLILLGIVYLSINLAPVREFCLFAAVVIITDWFMLHTFFLTVLSIDAQRLELADVLATNGAMQPENAKDKDAPHSAGFSWRRILRARMAKSGSLILMLFSIGSIYYLTERHRYPNTIAGLYGYSPSRHPSTTLATASKIATTPFTTTTSTFLTLSPAIKLWRSLNPTNLASILLTIPPASILILPRIGHSMSPSDIRKLAVPASRLLLPRLRPLFFFFKVVVLPEGVTAVALYMLLLYLLKDRDLLAAQRNKLGRGEVDVDPGQGDPSEASEGVGNQNSVKAYMLPCSHEVDIDLIATSEDGRVVVSIGIDNSVVVWKFTDSTGASGTREILRGLGDIQDEPITAVALDRVGKRLALSSAERIHILEVVEDRQTSLMSSYGIPQGQRITSIALEEGANEADDPFEMTTRASSPSLVGWPDISLTCHDGTVLTLDRAGVFSTCIPGSESSSRVFRLGEGSMLISSSSGTMLYTRDDDRMGWSVIDLGIPVRGTRVTSAVLSAGILALGFRSGRLGLFDGVGSPIASRAAKQTSSPIKHVAISSPLQTRCSTCKTTSPDLHHFIITSTSTTLHIDRLIPRNSSPPFCRCSSQSMDDAHPRRPSPPRLIASTRTSPSPHASPNRSPSLLSPVSNGDFPLSSHGIRRLSNVHGTGNGHGNGSRDEGGPNPPGSVMMGHTTSAGSGSEEWEIQTVGSFAIPGGEGCWEVIGDSVVGLMKVGSGIGDEQWDVWTVDLNSVWNGSGLNVHTMPLSQVLGDTRRAEGDGEERDVLARKRKERLLSLSGRASFPVEEGVEGGSSIPVYDQLGYVGVRPWVRRGRKGIIAGFGNRLGVMELEGDGDVGVVEQKGMSMGVGAGLGMPSRPPPSRRNTGDGMLKKVN